MIADAKNVGHRKWFACSELVNSVEGNIEACLLTLEVEGEDVRREQRPEALASTGPWRARRCRAAGLGVVLGLVVLQVPDQWR